MEVHDEDQRRRRGEDTQPEQTDGGWTQPSALHPPIEQPDPSPRDQSSEVDPRGITLFRAPTFNVHAFASRSHIESQQNPKRGGFLQTIGWSLSERRRLIDAETHPLPQVEIAHVFSHQQIALPTWLEGLVVALFLGITLVTQALSLFTYPAYTSDEGIYMANAWAVLQGKLTAYTFTYNHPPLGWIQIALWTRLTGGITSFGNAINSGRILMLALAMASSLLLYMIARQLSGSRSAGLLAMVLYTLSPLSLLYRHEVLLDNMGTFWLLLSLYLITNGKSRLGAVVLAAAALASAILSKGVFLIFLPAMLYAVWLHVTHFQLVFLLIAFLYIVLALISIYALFALLKGELVPQSPLSGGAASRPNLLETFIQTFQAPGPQTPFHESWNTWLQLDLPLLAAGILAVFINILAGAVNRRQLLVALFAATFCMFLLFSRVVYAFAIVPLLPFLALNIAVALNNSLHRLARWMHIGLARALLIFVLIGALVPAGIQRSWSNVSQNQTEAQQEAMWWIGDHVSRNAVVITNSYLYTDLHDPVGLGTSSETPFIHAQIYSDAALDPAIAVGELKQDWQNIDFLVIDSSLLQTIQRDKRYFLLDQALHHAILRAIFGSSADGTLIEIYQVVRNEDAS